MRATRRRAVLLLGTGLLTAGVIVGPALVGMAGLSAQAAVVAEDEGDGGAAESGGADPGSGGDQAPVPPSEESSSTQTPDAPSSPATPDEGEESSAPQEQSSKKPSAGDEEADEDSTDTGEGSVDDEDASLDDADLDLDADAADDGEPDPVDDPSLEDEDQVDDAIDEALDGEEVLAEEDPLEGNSTDASIVIDVTDVDGVQVTVGGSGLQPNSRVELWAFSSPRLLVLGAADAAGEVSLTAALPSDLGEGEHTLLLKGTDASGQPLEFGSGVLLGPDGELLGTTSDVDLAGLETPVLSDNPKAPPYQPVVALDQPAAVVSTAIAAFAIMSVTGAGIAAAASRPSSSGSGVAGGGINEGLNMAGLQLADMDVSHNRGWRTKFQPVGAAPGDRSWLHRMPLTSYVDEASYRLSGSLGRMSPLLARIVADAAPLRAMTGSTSLLLPLAGVALGAIAAVTGEGIAQPPAIGLLIALMVIGIVDAMAGGLAALSLAITVGFMGGIIDWSSVRTLMGVALLIVGPGLIASSFREIRRAAPNSFAAWWERGADLVIVPLLGAYTTYAIATALPPLGGALFPVADHAAGLALLVAGVLIAKVLLEEAAARWFPERLATVTQEADWPGIAQQILSALIRLAIFLFVSAAFIGMPWQLWVGGLIWFVPLVLAPFAARLPNAPRLWQLLPQSVPYLSLSLLLYLILAGILGNAFGDSTTFALMSFFILLIPDLILGVLWLFGREPVEGDVRWYLRPSMVVLYRVGGVVVLGLAIGLAAKSLF